MNNYITYFVYNADDIEFVKKFIKSIPISNIYLIFRLKKVNKNYDVLPMLVDSINDFTKKNFKISDFVNRYTEIFTKPNNPKSKHEIIEQKEENIIKELDCDNEEEAPQTSNHEEIQTDEDFKKNFDEIQKNREKINSMPIVKTGYLDSFKNIDDKDVGNKDYFLDDYDDDPYVKYDDNENIYDISVITTSELNAARNIGR